MPFTGQLSRSNWAGMGLGACVLCLFSCVMFIASLSATSPSPYSNNSLVWASGCSYLPLLLHPHFVGDSKLPPRIALIWAMWLLPRWDCYAFFGRWAHGSRALLFCEMKPLVLLSLPPNIHVSVFTKTLTTWRQLNSRCRFHKTA